MTTPKIKRTRKHVVIRLTPKESEALFVLTRPSAEIPARLTRPAAAVRRIAQDAAKLGETELPKKKNWTNITPTGSGLNLRKGGKI